MIFTSAAAATKIATIWKSLTFRPGRNQEETSWAVDQNMSNRSCHCRRRSHNMRVGEGQLEVQHLPLRLLDASMTVKHHEELSGSSPEASWQMKPVQQPSVCHWRGCWWTPITRQYVLLSSHRSAKNLTFPPANVSLIRWSVCCYVDCWEGPAAPPPSLSPAWAHPCPPLFSGRTFTLHQSKESCQWNLECTEEEGKLILLPAGKPVKSANVMGTKTHFKVRPCGGAGASLTTSRSTASS